MAAGDSVQEIDAETVTASVADAPPAEAPAPNRRGAFVATGAMVGTGIVLGAAFFPLMFDRWMNYDDGGMFSVSLKVLLHNGSLYDTVWADKYGPFYYLVMTTLYRVMHQEPTVANGRWIVLVLTVGSAGIFGAAVWRVTGSIPASVVCEVAAFLILIEGAANEPMHPGALGVLLIAVVVFELAAYAIRPTHWHLFVVGAASGALLMTKLNAGLLVVVAIVVAFSVGNALVPRSLRLTITALAAATPFVLILQSLASIREAELAFVVGIAVIGTAIVMSIDELVIPPRSLAWAIAGVGVALLGSLAFAIATGTSLSAAFTGVVVRPLDQAGQLTVAPRVGITWIEFLLTLAGIAVAYVFASLPRDSIRRWAPWTNAALAVFGLWLLGVGATIAARDNATAEWLPALALLPAAAFCSRAGRPARFAVRSFVVLAALQVLVAYPVAGTQVLWGTVAMTVPCAIAVAVGVDRMRMWRDAASWTKALATAMLCGVLVIASSQWPPALWRTYVNNASLGLDGTSLLRVEPAQADGLRAVSDSLREECDAFYGVPNENSFYLFTGIKPFSGMVADRPIGLTRDQQRQLINTFRNREAAGERVCVLRDASIEVDDIPKPLSVLLNKYTRIVSTIPPYTISRRNA